MKSKFWLLLLISCLISLILFSPSNIATAEESGEPKDQIKNAANETEETPELVIQDEFGFTKEQTEKLKVSGEKYEFQTEVSRLMKLIINSLYKTREIFLREIISNASDAIDKIRFLSLTDPDALSYAPTLNITIWVDKVNKILTIRDFGIGMTRKQLIENLGTIAKSGTSEFLTAMEDKKADMNLIGQFGVGFYSVFLVSDKVIVTTKHNDDKQYIWESQAVNDFTIAEDPRGNTLGRGTQIRLFLKEDAIEFLEESNLRNLILKYSEFINFPIWLWTKREEVVEFVESEEIKEESTDTTDSKKDNDDLDQPKIQDVTDKPDEGKSKERKTKTIEVPGWELMNTQKPLWTRDPKNITDYEYEKFYMSFAKDGNLPLAWTHFKAEGEVEFKSIVYIPGKAPEGLYQKVQDYSRNVKLFVKRVFITDEFLDFVPKYLAFIRAVIDADDLPLNVSRETLQQHRTLQLIKKRIIKKCLELITDLSKDEEKFTKFLGEFGTSLKIGAIEDNKNRKKIAQVLRFPSSHKESNSTTLDEYIGRMKKGQDSMYFITGSSVEEVQNSPFVEGLVARGYEVLYMVEPIDEMLVQHMPGHGGKMFKNVAKEIKFGDENFSETQKLKTKFIKLIDNMQSTLMDQVEKIEISTRLTKSPCAVAATDWGWTGNMQKIMAAQPFKQENPLLKDFYAKQKTILEINPNHPLILGLLEKAESDSFDAHVKEMVRVLYETTLVLSGYSLKDNLRYAARVEKLIRSNLGVDLDAEADVNVTVAEEADKNDNKEKVEIKDLFEEQEEQDDDSTDPTKPVINPTKPDRQEL